MYSSTWRGNMSLFVPFIPLKCFFKWPQNPSILFVCTPFGPTKLSSWQTVLWTNPSSIRFWYIVPWSLWISAFSSQYSFIIGTNVSDFRFGTSLKTHLFVVMSIIPKIHCVIPRWYPLLYFRFAPMNASSIWTTDPFWPNFIGVLSNDWEHISRKYYWMFRNCTLQKFPSLCYRKCIWKCIYKYKQILQFQFWLTENWILPDWKFSATLSTSKNPVVRSTLVKNLKTSLSAMSVWLL